MKTKKDLLNEIEDLLEISWDLYKALQKTPDTIVSKEAMDNFIKYIMEKE
jgi:hypothetical protein